MKTLEEYKEKNFAAFNMLNLIIDEGNVKYLLASVEMSRLFERMMEVPEGEPVMVKYRDIFVIEYPYLPAGAVIPVMKGMGIKFTMTCLCGHWDDEPHP